MSEYQNVENDSQDYNDQYLEEPKKNRALPFLVTLFIASLILNGWLYYKYVRGANEIKEQNKELTLLYDQANLRADSLQQELDFVNSQLQDKINELLAQEDLKESLRQNLQGQKRKLNAAYARITRLIENGGEEGYMAGEGGPKTLAQAKQEIRLLQEANQQKIAEVQTVQQQYKAAQESAAKFGNTAKIYRMENDSLIEVTSDLQDKLVEASVLRIQNLMVSPEREKRGSFIPEVKASKVQQLKINFSTVASGITPKEDKELNIRIKSPTGEVLSESTSKLTNIDEVFTTSESIQYDGTAKPVTIYYKQDGKFKAGKYKFEIYHDDVLMDAVNFTLR